MSDASLNQIYEAIGSLKSEVTSLRRDIQEDAQNAVDAARRADDHRAVMHRRLDEIVTRTGKLEGQMVAVTETVGEVKEVTDTVKMWEQRGLGALAVAGIAGTAIGGIAAGFIVYWWDAIMRLLRAA